MNSDHINVPLHNSELYEINKFDEIIWKFTINKRKVFNECQLVIQRDFLKHLLFKFIKKPNEPNYIFVKVSKVEQRIWDMPRNYMLLTTFFFFMFSFSFTSFYCLYSKFCVRKNIERQIEVERRTTLLLFED